jgi:peptidyl carrier protein
MSNDPFSDVARRVEEIWSDVLGVAEISGETTFLELGGQSISAVRIAARIEDELGVLVDIGDLFEDPDLPTFVRQIVSQVADTTTPDTKSA